MKNASQYNISIQSKLDDSEGCEDCERSIGDSIEDNQMHQEDIRNINHKSIDIELRNNEYSKL